MGNLFSKSRRMIYTSLAAIVAACSDGTGPSKQIGAPVPSVSAIPPQGRGIYDGDITAGGQVGAYGELELVTLKIDGEPNRSSNTIPFIVHYRRDNSSDTTEIYRVIEDMLQRDGQTKSDTIYITNAPSNAPTLSALTLPSQVIGRFQENVSTTATPDLGRTIQRIWLDLNLNGQKDAGETTNGNGGTGPLTANGQGNYENISGPPVTLFFRREIEDNIGNIVRDSSRVIVLPYVIVDGKIFSIVSRQPIQGARVIAAGDTATTTASGNYAIVNGTKQLDTILVSAPGHQTPYLTFLRYSTEQGRGSFSLIPDSLIIMLNDLSRERDDGTAVGLRALYPSITYRFVAYTDSGTLSLPTLTRNALINLLTTKLNRYGTILRNIDQSEIEWRSGPIPPLDSLKEDGVIYFIPSSFGQARAYVPNNDYRVRGGIVWVYVQDFNGVLAAHEFGHVVYGDGHPVIGERSIMARSTQETGPTDKDSLIGVIISSGERQLGSLPPDNEPPAGTAAAASASSNLYNNNMRVIEVREPADFGVPQTQNTNLRHSTVTGASANNVPAQVTRQPVLERVVADSSYKSSGSFRDGIYKAISDIFLNLPH